MIARCAGAAGITAAAYWTMFSSQSQLFGPFPRRGRADRREVALTFDDGPNEPFTSELAQLLSGYAVPATFFAVGRNVERFPGLAGGLRDAGHVVGNHSYSHALGRCLTPARIRAEVDRGQDVLGAELGVAPALYRPPWLARTPALFDALAQRDLTAVSGTFCHPLEPWQPSAPRLARRALARIRPGSMIIFHDGYNAGTADRRQTLDAVRLVLDTLAAQGIACTTVDQLLTVDAYR